MKIKRLEIENYPPIKNLKIENFGSLVIIAGANGAGKTRLKQAIVQAFQGAPQINLEITTTREEEKLAFQGTSLAVKKGERNIVFENYIKSRNFGRGKYVGSLVQIDSDRNIQTIKYSPVNWLGGDPDDVDTPGNYYFNIFSNRWQQFINYIHQKSASRDKKIADELKENPSEGENILKRNPDPLEKYKVIFSQLVPGKELQDINLANPKEFSYKDSSGIVLPFNSLSSGEQEVIKVLFDVVSKDIKHSIIIVDEPELHLHPTLTFKLIETLKSIGEYTNQFIFLTHSADLISTYYSTGDVYFIDAIQSGSNQAHKLSELNHSHKELVQLVGENLGLFAVGKKLIFIEGEDSSIDRLTYHLIAQTYLPESKILSVGSVENIITLNSIEEQIRKSIFGIDFYMIRDRDGLSDNQIQAIEKNGKIKCLKKRHIENYFLDAEILFKVAERFYLASIRPELTKDFIEIEIQKIASETLNINLSKNIKEYLRINHNFLLPNVKLIETKSADDIKNEMIIGVQKSIELLSDNLLQGKLEQWIVAEKMRLEASIKNESWKNEFHGKIIFSKLCSDILKDNPIKIRQAYIDIALKDKPEVFKDIIEIFKSFE